MKPTSENWSSLTENPRFLMLIVPFIVVPAWAIFIGAQRLGPHAHVGVAWRLLLALPLTLVMGGALALLLRPLLKKSASQETTQFVLLCTMPLLAFQIVGYVNVAGDRTPGRAAVVRCMRFIRGGKGGSRVELTSWTDPTRTLTMESGVIDEDDCATHRPIPIVIHPGLLGAAWISKPR